ncbi:hypothetical protein IQ07DRAFT_178952 [Pyrenochaeta sp. DS3sAY3a]|nr:hypothetical protein IQ07DRAFT_178952 [Pyrenochaeta sp. DS3sAY3a]
MLISTVAAWTRLVLSLHRPSGRRVEEYEEHEPQATNREGIQKRAKHRVWVSRGEDKTDSTSNIKQLKRSEMPRKLYSLTTSVLVVCIPD